MRHFVTYYHTSRSKQGDKKQIKFNFIVDNTIIPILHLRCLFSDTVRTTIFSYNIQLSDLLDYGAPFPT